MATLGGIEGKGSVTLQRGAGGQKRYVGAIFVDPAEHRRAVGLAETGSPARFVGRVEGESTTVTLNVTVTKVHAPIPLGVRVDFVSTGAPITAES